MIALGTQGFLMLHRTVSYDVREVEPGLWRWGILAGNGLVKGPRKHRSRELAVEACLAEINNGIERGGRHSRPAL